MRDPDIDFYSALVNARAAGIVPRKLVTITGRDFETYDDVAYSFWTGADDVTISVPSGVTGAMVSRLFMGGGALLSVSSIPRVSDLTIQTVTVTFSQVADSAQAMARGMDLRLGRVEIYDALLDPRQRTLCGSPQLVFLGEIDGAPIETPEVGGEGAVRVAVRSDAISMLTRKNPEKSSYENQRLRSGDEWSKYAGTVKTWRIPWGQKQ